MGIIECIAAGQCLWFMAATIAFLLTGLSHTSRNRELSPPAVILLAPILLVLAATRPLERAAARLLYSRQA